MSYISDPPMPTTAPPTTSPDPPIHHVHPQPDVLIWGIIDVFIILFTLSGNILTVCAIKMSRKLSANVSNQFIFSLALSDIMVALFMPYHFAFYVDSRLGDNKQTCLTRFVLICLACSCSIYHLLAIAGDRYLAIIHPLRYARYMTFKTAYIIIFLGWGLSVTLATVPIYWNNWEYTKRCEMDSVIPAHYMNFIVTPMFILIWLVMLVVYFRIWREASVHARRLRNTTNWSGTSDSKSVQVVLLILGCFSICWLPYFITIICERIYDNIQTHIFYEVTFTLAMSNSGMNPLIYAWKNSNFRKAFWCLLRCRSLKGIGYRGSFITNHVPSKKNSAANNVNGVCNGKEVDITQSERGLELRCSNEEERDRKCSVITDFTNVNSLPRTI